MATNKKSSNSPVAIYSDKDWQAEDDMRTLIRASEIRADKKRLAAAKAAARRKLGEKQEEVSAMKSLAQK